jgi:hypothetical protein
MSGAHDAESWLRAELTWLRARWAEKSAHLHRLLREAVDSDEAMTDEWRVRARDTLRTYGLGNEVDWKISMTEIERLRARIQELEGEAHMKQKITERHDKDENGNPAGGKTEGIGIAIEWQNGPLGRGADRKEPNGAFVEGVIQAAIGRLQFFQSDRRFSCRENALAITKLEEALMWLQKRTEDREAREVEGTHAP